MKLLLDFLPLIAFFGTFRLAEARKEWAVRFCNDHFGFLVSGGVIGPDEASVLLATLMVIAVSLITVLVLLLRGKKVGKMLWFTLVVVVVLGAATVWFHDKTFIKWKPTLVYWVTAVSLLISQLVFRKNLIRAAMKEQIEVPDAIWSRANIAWAAFFAAMGLLNLYVAFNFEFQTWVDFKTFGGIGLPLVFAVATGFYLTRHMPPEPAPAVAPKLPS